MTQKLISRILLVAILLLSICIIAFSQPTEAKAQMGNWNLIWEDNFTGAVGAPPDTTKWGYDLGGWGWGNQELQYYTYSPENAHIANDANAGDGQALKITAKQEYIGLNCWYGPCQYTSARLLTKNKFTFQYGKFEIRAKVPTAPGTWPAFWMLGQDIESVNWPNCGEIDILEVIGLHPQRVYGTLHGPGYSGGSAVGQIYEIDQPLSNDYHTYAVEWQPGEIRWYLDGFLYSTKTPADIPAGTSWVYDHPFFMILNLAVGNNPNWPGVADPAFYPQSMLVDYVRVYQDSGLPTFTPTPNAVESTAFSGTPVTLPGRIEIEDFDLGGEGSAYHELSAGNNGGSTYRSDAPNVDVADWIDGGRIINYFGGGEWLKYEVSVATAGTYTFSVNHAGPGGSNFHLETESGQQLGYFTLPSTDPSNPWGTYKVYSNVVNLPVGTYSIKFAADGPDNLNNLDWIQFDAGIIPTNTPTATATLAPSTPYSGTPIALPARIQAEDFDRGGNGAGYNEYTGANLGGATYRPDSPDVDIAQVGDMTLINYFSQGEWMRYTVTVDQPGVYTFRMYHAGPGGSIFHLETDMGQDLTGLLTQPNTGNWGAYQVYSREVTLPAGTYGIRLVADASTGNLNNLDWIEFDNGTLPTPTVTPTFTPTPLGWTGDPYYGTPISLPGKIQAEDYNLGGEGAAYHDVDGSNNGGQYRQTEGVDIEASVDAGGGFNVGWTEAGEWLHYAVDIAANGTYDLHFRVASGAAGGNFHLEVDGVNVTGSLNVPATGGWQNWITVSKSGVDLTAGQHTFKLIMEGWPGNFNWIDVVPAGQATNTPEPTFTPTESTGGNGTPYLGSPVSLPGKIEIENYNLGGEGVAYHDDDTSNNGNQYGNTFRTTEGVDTQPSSDIGGGFNIGWTMAGEWLNYAVNVTETGTYNLSFRVATGLEGGDFHLEVDGVNVTGSLTLPPTGDWQNWTTVTKNGVALTAGEHNFRLVMEGYPGNFNWINVEAAAEATPTLTPSSTVVAGNGSTVYVIDGASTTTSGALSLTEGGNADSDTIPTAGGPNHVGTPFNQIAYVISGVTGTYDNSATKFNLYLDSGQNIANGVHARVSYDFEGDGSFDRVETYHYFATDPVDGWELYREDRGLLSSSGAFADLNNGTVMLELWSAIGTADSTVRTSATTAQGQQSVVTIPFSNVTIVLPPTATPTLEPTSTPTDVPTETVAPTVIIPTNTATDVPPTATVVIPTNTAVPPTALPTNKPGKVRPKLKLNAECSTAPNVYRSWSVENKSNTGVTFTWALLGTWQHGRLYVAANSEVTFQTIATNLPINVMTVWVNGELHDTAIGTPKKCK